MKVVLTENVLVGGRRLLAGACVDLPSPAGLVAQGLAVPVTLPDSVEVQKPVAAKAVKRGKPQ